MKKKMEFEQTGSCVGYLPIVFQAQSTKGKLHSLKGVDIYHVKCISEALTSAQEVSV